MQAYGDSKISNLYFTFELQRRLNQNGESTKITAAHPGWTATDLQRHSGFIRFLNTFFAQKPEAGAWPTLLAAVDETAKGSEFYGPKGFMEMKGYPKKVKPNTMSQDEDIAARLWDVSEQLTGVKF
jgi:NAD(P)-dependent dehydrogenase (short-subunit alcohol dehydrogenase family)